MPVAGGEAYDQYNCSDAKEEFKEMIEASIEQKLLEILGDPDEGRDIRESVRDRLLRQRKAVAAGERGQSFDDVVQQAEALRLCTWALLCEMCMGSLWPRLWCSE
jgi:hypothetical protein